MRIEKILCGLLLSTLLLASCKSREEKVLETIKANMFKTLEDFESYEPIETKIDSLKYDMYGDTIVVKVIFKMKLMEDLIDDFEDKYKKAKKNFDIWDDPHMYNYSDYAYNKRKKAFEEMQIAAIAMEATENVLNSYIDTLLIIDKNHTGELCGWRVSHKFRYKPKGESPEICNYVYFMDMNCENIFWSLDEAEWSWDQYVRYIDDALDKAKE